MSGYDLQIRMAKHLLWCVESWCHPTGLEPTKLEPARAVIKAAGGTLKLNSCVLHVKGFTGTCWSPDTSRIGAPTKTLPK